MKVDIQADLYFDRKLEELKTARGKRKYSKLKLEYNPFPVTGIAREGYLFPPLSERVKERVAGYVISESRGPEYKGLAVIGDYGMGKSHILKWLTNRINQDLGKEGFIAVYLDNPGTNPKRLIQTILEHTGLDEFRKYLGLLILDKFYSKYGRRGSDFLKQFYGRYIPLFSERRNPRKLFSKSNRLNFLAFFSEFKRQGFDEDKLKEFVKTYLVRDVIRESTAAEHFSLLLFGDEYSAYKSWESLTGDLKTRQAIEKSQREFFKGIVRVLQRQGCRHIYVMLDEFEDIPLSSRISKPKSSEYLTIIRLLIDRNIPHISVVIGTAPEGWKELEERAPALASRFMRFHLPLLDKKQLERILINYLNLARGMRGKFREERDSIAPFTAEILSDLLKTSGGNLRVLIMKCHRLIDHAAEKGIEKIDKRAFNRIGKEFPDLMVKEQPPSITR